MLFNLSFIDYLSICLVAFASYLIRASFVASSSPLKVNVYLRIAIDHIPGTCLMALVLQLTFIIDGEFSVELARITAIIAATLAGYFWRNLYAPLLVGFSTLWLTKYLL